MSKGNYEMKHVKICVPNWYKNNSFEVNQKQSLIIMHISNRLFNILSIMKINDLVELTNYSPNDLLKYKNVGIKTITEINELLSKYNLKLKENIIDTKNIKRKKVQKDNFFTFRPNKK